MAHARTTKDQSPEKPASGIDKEREAELIAIYQKSKSSLAIEELFGMREGMLQSMAPGSAHLDGGDEGNVLSELKLTWLKSIEEFDVHGGTPFGSYLSSNLKNRLTDLAKKRYRRKRTIHDGVLVSFVPFDPGDPIEEQTAGEDPWTRFLASVDSERWVGLIAGRDNVIRNALERLRTGTCANLRDACRWKRVKVRIRYGDRYPIWNGFGADRPPQATRHALRIIKYRIRKSGKCHRGFKLYGRWELFPKFVEGEVLDNSDEIYKRVLMAIDRAKPLIERELHLTRTQI